MSLCHPSGRLTFSGLATGKSRPVGACVSSVAALPTDPIGAFNLTLTNVVVGSAILVETQGSGLTLYNGIASTSSPVISLSTYSAGSPYNSLRIKVRKGTSSPYYRAYETLATAFVGAQSIYVSQIPDE